MVEFSRLVMLPGLQRHLISGIGIGCGELGSFSPIFLSPGSSRSEQANTQSGTEFTQKSCEPINNHVTWLLRDGGSLEVVCLLSSEF